MDLLWSQDEFQRTNDIQDHSDNLVKVRRRDLFSILTLLQCWTSAETMDWKVLSLSLCSCFSEMVDVSVFIGMCISLQTAGWTLQYGLDLCTEHISKETHFTLMNWLLHVIYSESHGPVRTEDSTRGFLSLFWSTTVSFVDVINDKIRCVLHWSWFCAPVISQGNFLLLVVVFFLLVVLCCCDF